MNTPAADEFPKLGPPRDRRRHRRFLTLRNSGRVAIVAVICLTLVSVATELHRGRPGEYGRLYSRRTRSIDLEARQPYTIIRERTIGDQTGADPMLLDAARRQQYLGVTDADMQELYQRANPQPPVSATPIIINGQPGLLEPNSNREKARIEISGGPEGVQVETKPPNQ